MSPCYHVVDGLFDCIVYGTHGYDYVLCIRSAVVVEQLVISTDLLVDLVHVLLDNSR